MKKNIFGFSRKLLKVWLVINLLQGVALIGAVIVIFITLFTGDNQVKYHLDTINEPEGNIINRVCINGFGYGVYDNGQLKPLSEISVSTDNTPQPLRPERCTL